MSEGANDPNSEWVRHVSAEHGGQFYYHNLNTGETVWEEPSSWHDAEDDEDEEYEEEEQLQDGGEQQYGQLADTSREQQIEHDAEAPEDECAWKAVQDPSGNTYYVHEETDQTRWDEPEEHVQWRLQRQAQIDSAAADSMLSPQMDHEVDSSTIMRTEQAEPMDVDDAALAAEHISNSVEPAGAPPAATASAEPEDVYFAAATIQPPSSVLKEQQAAAVAAAPQTQEDFAAAMRALETQLSEPDFVMEPGAFAKLKQYTQDAASEATLAAAAAAADGSGSEQQELTLPTSGKRPRNEAAKKASNRAAATGLNLMVQGYRGYAQYAVLAGQWLKAAGASSVAAAGSEDADPDVDPEELMLEQLEKALFSAFDGVKADKLLDQSAALPKWLRDLLDSPRWRRVLVKLFDQHRDSVLLRFLLRHLSDRGHHAEIAVTVSVADIFHVFNGVLQDCLGQIPTADSTRLLVDQLPDLKRMCCSTDYMFAYSQELLRVLEERSAAGEVFSLTATANTGSKSKGKSSSSSSKSASAAKQQHKALAAASEGSTAGEGDSDAEAATNGHAENGHADSAAAAGGKSVSSDGFSQMCARKFRRLRQELAAHALDGMPAPAAAAAVSAITGSSSGHSAAAASASATAAPAGAPPTGEAVCLLGAHRSQIYTDSSSSSTSSGSGSNSTAAANSTSLTDASSSNGSSGSSKRKRDAEAAAAPSLLSGECSEVRGALMVALGHATSRQPVALPAEAVMTLLSCYRLEALANDPEGDVEVAPATWTMTSSDTDVPPVEYLRYPRLMQQLIEATFDSVRRSPRAEIRRACCALLGYATAAECGTEEVIGAAVALQEACHLCAAESRLGHLVKQQLKLRSRAEQYPVVSAASLIWARSQVASTVLTKTPLYLTMAPLFLQLSRLAIDAYPLQRPTAFELLKDMLKVARDDKGGVEAAVNIKKDTLRLMAHLMAGGYVVHVLAHFTASLQGPSRLDQSLVRYFLGVVFTMALPRSDDSGYSSVYVSAMVQLLGHIRARDAVVHPQFDKKGRACLVVFLQHCLSRQGGISGASRELLKGLHTQLAGMA